MIGLGGIGSATAWFAARAGRSVIGLERFALGGHHRGASHDHSRIIRHSYHTEHYVHLSRLAYDAWRQAEAESGETCVHITGGIDLFPRGAAIGIDTLPRLDAGHRGRLRGIDRQRSDGPLAGMEVAGRHRGAVPVEHRHRLAGGDRAAAATPGKRSGRHRCAAKRRSRRSSRRTTTFGCASPTAPRSSLPSVVVAADAWTAPLIEPLGTSLPLVVTGEQVTYYDTDTPERFGRRTFPVWIWMDDPSFYGFPVFGRPGVKIAQDCGGMPVDPDTRGFEPDPAILARTDAFAAEAFGGRLGVPLSTTTCLYTLTPDRDFVVDSLPGSPQRSRRPRCRPRLQVRRLVRAHPGRAGHRRQPGLRPHTVPPRSTRPHRPVVGAELAGVVNCSSSPSTNGGCRGSGLPSVRTIRARRYAPVMPRCTRSQIAQS